MTSLIKPAALPDSTALLAEVVAQINQVILGKDRQVRLALACLLARGHLLIEDLPGVGKTTLAQVLARTLGLEFKRIQFTSDLLPADIIGVSTYRAGQDRFEFHPGPVFAPVVLADEINRATPKTQSALLEAMEERQITSDGVTHALPEPFFVIATQNPRHQIGTFPLPESQLDRFLLRIDLGYPDRDAERELLKGTSRRAMLLDLEARLTPTQIVEMQQAVDAVRASNPLLDYIQDLTDATRESGEFSHGLSPRAGLALLHAAKAWALLDERVMVLPEDVQTVAMGVITHRLQPLVDDPSRDVTAAVRQLLDAVPIP